MPDREQVRYQEKITGIYSLNEKILTCQTLQMQRLRNLYLIYQSSMTTNLWEVCRGGNSTHVGLYVHHNENGYYLAVAGKSWSRSIEAIKFYNVKGKDAICFTGVETNAKQNLENFSKCILEFGTGIETDTTFASFQAALEYVFKLSESKRIVLCMDEYPYIARASRSLASTLQLLIDKYKDTSKLFLILCGSFMSYMEDQVLAYKAPLYGRRTAQFKILPFEFREACAYFRHFSDEDKAMAYGIVGGTPQYLMQIDDRLSVEENIKNLVSLGILKKETPYGENSTRKTLYSIEDNMFRFWYRFVPENASIISRGAMDLAYVRIKPQLSDYMGAIFEEICKQYLWEELLSGNAAVAFHDLGRWWGTDARTRQQVEIDIMGTADKNTALFGECKWTNAKVDLGVLETLAARGERFPYSNKHYYLFAKTDFTKSCVERAEEMGNVTLVRYQDILKS